MGILTGMGERTAKMDVVEVLSRYIAGYFPLYDMNREGKGRFYWERLAVRAVVPVDREAVARARRMGRRGKGRFEIRYTTAVEEVIGMLRREEIKERTWVKEEVVEIYRAPFRAGLLRTVEAWSGEDKSYKVKSYKDGGQGKKGRQGDEEKKLVGGLLGIVVPGTFIAETMFGVVGEASKVCLCRLVEDCFAAGVEMIDVQTPHDVDEWGLPRGVLTGTTAHPCVRLGEKRVAIGAYLRGFAAAWKRAFDGGVEEWLETALAFREGREVPEEMGRMLGVGLGQVE